MPLKRGAIEIDDAGGGNLVGGLVIGALHGGRYESRLIGPERFDGNGLTRLAVAEAAADLVETCAAPAAEVHLCTSDLFDEAAARLAAAGRVVRRRPIEPPLQDLVEADFLAHLRAIGLPPYVERIGRVADGKKDLAYRALNEFSTNFVLVDPAARGALCKRTTRLWRRIESVTVEVGEVRLGAGRRASRRCANCGERVSRAARRYVAGTRTFYTHADCLR